MKTNAKITFRQYLKLLYKLTYSKPIMKLLLAVAALLLLWILLYYLEIFHLPEPLIYQYITLILILVVQPCVLYATIRRNYFSSNHLRETLEIELTPKELKIRGQSFYMEILLSKVFKIVERRNWFLVYQNNLSAVLIPKKDLTGQQLQECISIFKNIAEVPVHLL